MARGRVDVRVERADPTRVKADAIVLGIAKGATPDGKAATALDAAAGGGVARMIAHGDFEGKLKETAVFYLDGAGATRLLAVGTGEAEKLTLDRVRQIGARAAKRARDLGCRTVAMTLPPGEAEATARALVEGALLGLYTFERYKTRKPDAKEPEKRVEALVLVEPDARRARAAERGAERGRVVAECVNLARDWATVSGEDAWAPNLAKDAAAHLRRAGLRVEAFDLARIRKLGMGGVLAVHAGSGHEPRFVVVEHGRAHKAKTGTLVLVGKGVTFDSGGLSIKPADKMDEMKFDKAGAAAVWATMLACARLDLPVHVVGLTPVVENVLSATSMKPGDVFTAYNGKSFEVLNTDAEGRLILADALAYAGEFEPSAIVDIATLTGHIVVALGALCSGMMGNDRALLDRVKAASDAAHERVAEMPFFEEYGDLVKGNVADVKNHAGRPGGAITAAKFMEAFVPEGVPWVHLDVAGTAWHDGKAMFNDEYSPGPATGVGVRTFLALIENWRPLPRKRGTSPSSSSAAPRAPRSSAAPRYSKRPRGASSASSPRSAPPRPRARRRR